LPLSLFAFGEEGLHRAAVIFAVMTLLQSSLGVLIASGRANFAEAFRLPYIYAATIGLTLRGFELELPQLCARPLSLLADTAVPLMLLALGLRLRTIKTSSWRKPLLITVARIGGGYLIAQTFLVFFPLDPMSRSILLLASIMPAAVVNFVFAEKYGDNSQDVATTVFVSTLVSLVTTPLLLAYELS
jgi:predicted permease